MNQRTRYLAMSYTAILSATLLSWLYVLADDGWVRAHPGSTLIALLTAVQGLLYSIFLHRKARRIKS